jgi:hypothetical protein
VQDVNKRYLYVSNITQQQKLKILIHSMFKNFQSNFQKKKKKKQFIDYRVILQIISTEKALQITFL